MLRRYLATYLPDRSAVPPLSYLFDYLAILPLCYSAIYLATASSGRQLIQLSVQLFI